MTYLQFMDALVRHGMKWGGEEMTEITRSDLITKLPKGTIAQIRAHIAGLEGAQEDLIEVTSRTMANLVIERAEMQQAIMTLQVKLGTAERTIAKLNDESESGGTE